MNIIYILFIITFIIIIIFSIIYIKLSDKYQNDIFMLSKTLSGFMIVLGAGWYIYQYREASKIESQKDTKRKDDIIDSLNDILIYINNKSYLKPFVYELYRDSIRNKSNEKWSYNEEQSVAVYFFIYRLWLYFLLVLEFNDKFNFTPDIIKKYKDNPYIVMFVSAMYGNILPYYIETSILTTEQNTRIYFKKIFDAFKIKSMPKWKKKEIEKNKLFKKKTH